MFPKKKISKKLLDSTKKILTV